MNKLSGHMLAGLLVASAAASLPMTVSATGEAGDCPNTNTDQNYCCQESKIPQTPTDQNNNSTDDYRFEVYYKEGGSGESGQYCYYKNISEAVKALNGYGVKGTLTIITPNTNNTTSAMKVELKAGYSDISVVLWYSQDQATFMGLPDPSAYFDGPVDTNKKFVGYKDENTKTIYHVRTKIPAFSTSGYTLTAVWTDKTELEALVKREENLTEDKYTAESWGPFETALEAAKAVLENPDAEQEDVDSAKKTLQDAVDGLQEQTPKEEVDKTGLREVANSVTDLNSSDYASDSWNKVLESRKSAWDVLDNPDAEQEDVDEAEAALKAAIEALVDITKLRQAVGVAGNVDTSAYTEETVEAFEKALAAAQAVLENPSATEAEISEAIMKLDEATENLEKKPVETPAEGEDETPAEGEEETSASTPNTGDNIAVWAITMLASASALIVLGATTLAKKKATAEKK